MTIKEGIHTSEHSHQFLVAHGSLDYSDACKGLNLVCLLRASDACSDFDFVAFFAERLVTVALPTLPVAPMTNTTGLAMSAYKFKSRSSFEVQLQIV